ENGSAERINRTIIDMARAMLKDAQLPEGFWSHAVNYVAYILNRVPTRALDENITPYQAYTGNKPSVAHLRVFGCDAHAFIPKGKRSKFGSKSLHCVHIGYSPRKRAYILLHRPSGRIFESRDVRFDEGSEGEHTRVVIDALDDAQDGENPSFLLKGEELT